MEFGEDYLIRNRWVLGAVKNVEEYGEKQNGVARPFLMIETANDSDM